VPCRPRPSRDGRAGVTLPPNRQTIAELHAQGMALGGLCGRPCLRQVEVDMPTLIDRVGPDVPVPDAIRRIVCAKCRRRMAIQVCSPSAPFTPRWRG
jgi:hypothetical protein